MATKTASRADRWNDAVGRAREALDRLKEAQSDFASAIEEVDGVRQEYEEWRDNMPDNLRYNSPTGEKLDGVVDLECEASEDQSISEMESMLDELEGADLPLGFGRD